MPELFSFSNYILKINWEVEILNTEQNMKKKQNMKENGVSVFLCLKWIHWHLEFVDELNTGFI